MPLQALFHASMAIENDFNKLGREGWEFVAITGEKKDHYAIFKRELAGEEGGDHG